MGEDTKYVPEGVFLVCDKGDIPTQLICDPHPINIYSVKYADENDNKPILNIQSFGTCKTLGTCAPPPGFTWINVKEDVLLHGSKPLLETSECLCPSGAGRIKIFLDEYAAFLAAENNSESAFVSEPISSMALGNAGLGLFGPVLSMLAPDFVEGVGRGIKKGAEGTWNFLTHDMWQADTWRALGRTAVVAGVYGMNAGKPAGSIQSDMMLRSLDNRFGTSFVQTRDALATGIERGVSHAIEDVRRGNWGEVGESVGQIEYAVVEAVVGTKGAGLALKGAKAATVAAVGAQRLAQIAAATSRVMQRMRGISGIVRIGRRVTPRTASFDDFVKSVKEFADGQNADLARQAHDLYTQQKWGELEELFNRHNLNGGYPPNGGAVATREVTLQPGTRIDRYGGWVDENGVFRDRGNFTSPAGESFDSRALPESSLTKPYNTYEVVKPIPNVREGQAIPWFGREGMGTQYEFPDTNIDELINGGYIRRVP